MRDLAVALAAGRLRLSSWMVERGSVLASVACGVWQSEQVAEVMQAEVGGLAVEAAAVAG
jgi:hypothetical protein